MVGKTILNYKITEQIGQGGMGVVYKAIDTKLDRPVALKFLSPNLSTAEGDKDRFIQEAKTVSSINHPNICTLFDIQEHDGQQFMVMEYLDGCDLRQLIPHDVKNPMPVREAVKYIVQIAEGLAAAHSQGIIHRDIKPENIIVRKDSIVQILDFGLAKLRGPSKLTKEGTTVGTLAYMAPEQLQNGNVDGRADIFSLGVIFYEMLAGQLPFKGDYEASMIYSILNDYPQSVFELRPELGEDINHIVMECLEKDPDERYQSVRELAKDLKRFNRDSSGTRRSQSRVAIPVTPDKTGTQPSKEKEAVTTSTGSARMPWMFTALSFIALLVMSFLYIQKPLPERESIQASILPPDHNNFAFTIEQKEGAHLALSPNGKMLAFVAVDSNRKSLLWLRRLNSDVAQPLVGTEDASYPFWSPDNRFIAFYSDGKLKKINAAGGPALTICDAVSGRGGDWNENDVIVFPPDQETGLFQVHAGGGTARQLTYLDSAINEETHRWPVFLPDGNHFLYFSRVTSGGNSENNAVHLGSLDGKSQILIPGIRSNLAYTNGYILYVRENTLMAHPFDEGSLSLAGDAVPVADNVQYSTIFSAAVFTISRNGRLVFQRGGANSGSNLVILDRAGNVQRNIGQPEVIRDALFSPDAQKIALTIYDVASRQMDIWVHDLNRDVRTRFTFHESDERWPLWSPDGKKIVFSSLRSGTYDLFIKKASGADAEQKIFKSGNNTAATSWSVNSQFIAVTENDQSTKWDINFLRIDQSDPEMKLTEEVYLETEFREFVGLFSPDDRWLGYNSDESGQNEVYVQPANGKGGKWQISRNGGFIINWNFRDDEIFYESLDGKLMAVRVKASAESFQVGALRKLFDIPGAGDGSVMDISQDGQQVLVTIPVGERSNNPLTLVTQWDKDLKK